MENYPQYYQTAHAVIAFLNSETALVVSTGGNIQITEGVLSVAAIKKNAIHTSKHKFEKQLNANIELIGELRKLLVT